MSLSDRLAQARRRTGTPTAAESANGKAASGERRAPTADPLAELKRTVHARLPEGLGPQLYDSRLTEDELRAANPTGHEASFVRRPALPPPEGPKFPPPPTSYPSTAPPCPLPRPRGRARGGSPGP